MTTTTIYSSTVAATGADAGEMLDGGVVIFFGEPCPKELAEVSIVHTPTVPPQRDPRAGDVLRVGGSAVTLTAVGELAGENLRTLGHIVVYTDPEPDARLLPGAIHASGSIELPSAGAVITLEGE